MDPADRQKKVKAVAAWETAQRVEAEKNLGKVGWLNIFRGRFWAADSSKGPPVGVCLLSVGCRRARSAFCLVDVCDGVGRLSAILSSEGRALGFCAGAVCLSVGRCGVAHPAGVCEAAAISVPVVVLDAETIQN